MFFPHFPDKETEAQSGEKVTCLRSHSQEGIGQDLNPGGLTTELIFLAILSSSAGHTAGSQQMVAPGTPLTEALGRSHFHDGTTF